MATNSTETIKISKKTKKQLDDYKIHPRESYDDVVNRIINKLKGGNKKK